MSAGKDKIRFICGCLLGASDSVKKDAEGFVTCPKHNERRYGWRSVPYTATTMAHPGQAAWTELEHEHFVLYGHAPERVA